jgi:hypothetical protein
MNLITYKLSSADVPDGGSWMVIGEDFFSVKMINLFIEIIGTGK